MRLFPNPNDPNRGPALPPGMTMAQLKAATKRKVLVIAIIAAGVMVAVGFINIMLSAVALLFGLTAVLRAVKVVVDAEAEQEKDFDLKLKDGLFNRVFPKFKYNNASSISQVVLRESGYGGEWDASGGNEYLSGEYRGTKVELCHVELGKSADPADKRAAKKPPLLVLNARWMVVYSSLTRLSDEALQAIVDRHRGERPVTVLRKAGKTHIIYDKSGSGAAEFQYYLLKKVAPDKTLEGITQYAVDELTMFRSILQEITG